MNVRHHSLHEEFRGKAGASPLAAKVQEVEGN